MGKYLILAGLGLALVGVLVHLGWLRWFGRLPGDFRHQGESVRVYVPITSMLVASAALSLVAWLARRLG